MKNKVVPLVMEMEIEMGKMLGWGKGGHFLKIKYLIWVKKNEREVIFVEKHYH